MAKTWGDQLDAQAKVRKRKERAKKRRARRAKVNAVKHPVKTAWKTWGLW